MQTALVIGADGQDGSYLCDHLAELGYEVHGAVRPSSRPLQRLNRDSVKVLHQCDVADRAALTHLLRHTCNWHEVYNLADQDHVGTSFECPGLSIDITVGAVSTMLEALKGSSTRIFQPISSTVFGVKYNSTGRIDTRLDPQSPYACAKAHAWHLCKMHRAVYGTKVSCGILYNHDSARRDDRYVLHEICKQLQVGRSVKLRNADVRLDVSWAPMLVRAFHRMLTTSAPTDAVLCSGSASSLRLWAVQLAGTSQLYISGEGSHVLDCGDHTRAVELGFLTREELSSSAEQLVADLQRRYKLT